MWEKDIWDKWAIGGKITAAVASVLVTLVIGVGAWKINSTLTEKELALKALELNIKYIQIAAGILTEGRRKETEKKPLEETEGKPPKDTEELDEDELRNWAVDIFKKYSPIPFPEKAEEELKKGRVLPKAVVDASPENVWFPPGSYWGRFSPGAGAQPEGPPPWTGGNNNE